MQMKYTQDSRSECAFTMIFYLFHIFSAAIQGSVPTTNSTNAATTALLHVKPNVFMFVADDLGFDSLSIHGNSIVHTPHIDAFARTSLRFNRMYTATAMCTPSRTSLLTGLYPQHHGAMSNHGHAKNRVVGLSQRLDDIGYNVQHIGKMHTTGKTFRSFNNAKLERIDVKATLQKALQKHQPLFLYYGSYFPHSPYIEDVLYFEDIVLNPRFIGYKGHVANHYLNVKILDYEWDRFYRYVSSSALYNNSIVIFTSDHGFEIGAAKYSCYERGLKVPFFLQVNGQQTSKTKTSTVASFVDVVPTILDLIGEKYTNHNFDGTSLRSLLNNNKITNLRRRFHKYVFGVHTQRGTRANSQVYPIRSVTTHNYKYTINLNWEYVNPASVIHCDNILSVLEELNNGANGFVNTTVFSTLSPILQAMYCRPPAELYNLKQDPFELQNLIQSNKSTHVKKRNQLQKVLTRWMKYVKDDGLDFENNLPTNPEYQNLPQIHCSKPSDVTYNLTAIKYFIDTRWD